MRRNKHKAVRRTVRFFKINYAFRAPFKVLVDGNFISAAEQLKLGCVQELVVKLLGATCKLYTSPCILSELRRVSKAAGAAGDVLAAAKRTWRHACGHEKKLSASDCILAQIGGANADHWFVATQDAELRSLLAQKGCIPLLYLSATGLHLEKPSEMAQVQASQKSSGAMALAEHELRSAPLQDLDELKKQQRAGEMSKFRRKRAKGPNPLSVKRKQLKKPASTGAPHAAASEAVASRKKRPRRRSAPALGSGLDAAPAPSQAR